MRTEKDYIKVIGGTHEDSTHPEFEKREREKAMGKVLDDDCGATLLDVGCSYGSWAMYFQNHGFSVTGVDISSERLKEAKRRGYKTVKASATKLPFKDNSFDTVVCLDMLVHVLKQSDRRKVVEELMRVAKSTVILSYASDKATSPTSPLNTAASRTSAASRTMLMRKRRGWRARSSPRSACRWTWASGAAWCSLGSTSSRSSWRERGTSDEHLPHQQRCEFALHGCGGAAQARPRSHSFQPHSQLQVLEWERARAMGSVPR